MENTRIESFNFENLHYLIDEVVPLWSQDEWPVEFRRFNVEFIIRNNIWENAYRFQLMENAEFLAAAFFARKHDVCNVEKWFDAESRHFTKKQLMSSNMSRAYLHKMDERTLEFMNDDDIKLSLFISRKSGCGSLILNKLCTQLHEEGWKNLYLWTDCECNWQWYFKHGFTLIQEAVYEPFSTGHEEYKTYIFKKPLC